MIRIYTGKKVKEAVKKRRDKLKEGKRGPHESEIWVNNRIYTASLVF